MKFLDLTGLNTLWAKIKTLVSGKADKVSNATANNFAGLDANGNLKDSGKKESDFALRNVTYGEQGYVSYSGANPDILLEKLKLGSLSLYNHGTTIQIYEYDAGDEENATLVWDSSNLTGTALQNFENGKELGTIYTSPAGKCVKVTYNGAKGGYNYIRAFGVFMTPKQVDSSHKATAIFRINGTNYKSYTIDTYGSLVTGICCNGNYTNAALLFTPNSDVVRMRFYGFRCLNTYAGTEGVLIGRSSSTLKLSSARKLAVNLANTSTDSTFDGSADQTGIKVSGKLPIANGGTNATTAADARTNLGAQASLPTTGTASDTYAINISGSSESCTGNAATATKATQDSDGNAINATYFKANIGTTTLQSGTAVNVGTQNGADVKLQLPTIPAAANNGALKICLNGGTATSKFTANQSGDSTLTFASGTTAGTINVDGTEVAVAGWSGKQDAMFVKFNFDSTLHYADVATALYAGKTPYLLDGRTMFVCDGSPYTVEVSGSTTTEYRFVAAVGNDSSPRIVYRYVRADNSHGSRMINLATDRRVSSLESAVTNHNTFFHTEMLNVTDSITRFLNISFSGRVGRASAIVLIGANNGNDSSAFRLSWFYDGTNPIGNFGRELFSVGNVNKKPLVYYDNNSFYIGLSEAGNWGATISVMLSCENPQNVSYSTVTRAEATGVGKTNLPLEWFAVYSKTISTIVKDTVIGNDLNTMYII